MLWKLSNIQALSTDTQQLKNTTIPIASTETLAVPPLRNYKMLLEQPLFWETRQQPPIAPVKTVFKPPEKPLDRNLPAGRLIGIIDTGSRLMAIVNHNNKSHYLHLNEQWGAWKISKIHLDAIELQLADETKTVQLVSDYASPAANKNQAIASKTEASVKRSNKGLSESRQATLPSAVNNLPHTVSTQKQVPPLALPAEMSIKEALKTRQRLMAERWQKRK